MQAEIDEKLLAEIRRLADEQGRSEREPLDEAVRRYLERSDPRRFDLDEDEAERIAYEELHAMRRERTETA